jgi:hypothetical protein
MSPLIEREVEDIKRDSSRQSARLSKELLLKRSQHVRCHFVAPNGQELVAPTLIASAEAGEPIAASHNEFGAADTTRRQPRE